MSSVRRILLFIWWLSLQSCKAHELRHDIVEENATVTIPCPSANRRYWWRRTWYRGYFSARNNTPSAEMMLYVQQKAETAYAGIRNRADLSVDPDTFELTIGRVQLEDDGFFTCKVLESSALNNIYHQTPIPVYIQPKITLQGLDATPYKENDNVTITCTIDRLYPEIHRSAFQMSWGIDTKEVTAFPNGDKSIRYTVQMTKTLTKEDNGKIIKCTVNPNRGDLVSEERSMIIQCPSSPDTRLPAAVGGIIGCVALIIIVTVVVIFYQLPTATRMASMKAPRSSANVYEDIDESGDPREGSSLGQAAETVNQYEELSKKSKITAFEDWVTQNNIAPSTEKKLQNHGVCTIEDLKALDKEDILELGLSVGDRNCLKIALKKLK